MLAVPIKIPAPRCTIFSNMILNYFLPQLQAIFIKQYFYCAPVLPFSFAGFGSELFDVLFFLEEAGGAGGAIKFANNL